MKKLCSAFVTSFKIISKLKSTRFVHTSGNSHALWASCWDCLAAWTIPGQSILLKFPPHLMHLSLHTTTQGHLFNPFSQIRKEGSLVISRSILCPSNLFSAKVPPGLGKLLGLLLVMHLNNL